MKPSSNTAVLEALRERFDFTVVDRRGFLKLPAGTCLVADVGVHLEHHECYVTHRPNSDLGLGQALHEFGHFLQAWWWKPHGSIEARRRIVKNHHDIEACVLACWAAELLGANANVKDKLAREYDEQRLQLKITEGAQDVGPLSPNWKEH